MVSQEVTRLARADVAMQPGDSVFAKHKRRQRGKRHDHHCFVPVKKQSNRKEGLQRATQLLSSTSASLQMSCRLL